MGGGEGGGLFMEIVFMTRVRQKVWFLVVGRILVEKQINSSCNFLTVVILSNIITKIPTAARNQTFCPALVMTATSFATRTGRRCPFGWRRLRLYRLREVPFLTYVTRRWWNFSCPMTKFVQNCPSSNYAAGRASGSHFSSWWMPTAVHCTRWKHWKATPGIQRTTNAGWPNRCSNPSLWSGDCPLNYIRFSATKTGKSTGWQVSSWKRFCQNQFEKFLPPTNWAAIRLVWHLW